MYKIRKAGYKDIGTLVKFGKQLNSFEYIFAQDFHKLDTNSNKKFVEYFRRHMRKRSSMILVAEYNGKPIGYLAAKIQKRSSIYKLNRVVELLDIFVCTEHRKSGVGTRMINFAIRQYSRRGFSHVVLFVLSKNKNALRFYRSLGFREFVKEMYRKA
jgi:ribosomal protein S18 acetylase RimI-like enzyme